MKRTQVPLLPHAILLCLTFSLTSDHNPRKHSFNTHRALLLSPVFPFAVNSLLRCIPLQTPFSQCIPFCRPLFHSGFPFADPFFTVYSLLQPPFSQCFPFCRPPSSHPTSSISVCPPLSLQGPEKPASTAPPRLAFLPLFSPNFFWKYDLWDYDCNLCNRVDIVAENFLSDIKLRAGRDNKGILPRRDRSPHTLHLDFF